MTAARYNLPLTLENAILVDRRGGAAAQRTPQNRKRTLPNFAFSFFRANACFLAAASAIFRAELWVWFTNFLFFLTSQLPHH